MSDIDISIIIRTKNEEKSIERCLSDVFNQKSDYNFEVIVIDSGSKDKTLEIVEKFPVEVIKIKPEEFNYGKTCNLGAEKAKGKYVVYLSAHAYPFDEHWVENLARNLDLDLSMTGAYSRQIPHPESDPMEVRRIQEAYSHIREVWTNKSLTEKEFLDHPARFVIFSNVSSCIRKDIWKKIPFEHLTYAEDQDWAKKVLEDGFKIVYEPQSVVYHSHNDSFTQLFRRFYYSSMAQRQITDFKMDFFFVPISVLLNSYANYKYLKKSDATLFVTLKWLIYGGISYSVVGIAQWAGSHPDSFVVKFAGRVL